MIRAYSGRVCRIHLSGKPLPPRTRIVASPIFSDKDLVDGAVMGDDSFSGRGLGWDGVLEMLFFPAV